ncbi:MAG: error-prone DNA polymerase, partial [Haliea sp.]|nr:error-prone DNA polymerase [Haliea sp.]
AGSYLRQLVEEGCSARWPAGVPADIQERIEYELQLIDELSYEYYFLTVYDIVRFARERSILCQGRGSAANSVVCYCLFITEVSPEAVSLLFERFISRERDEPPDIDVDFEHERREEVIQYIYNKYSRRRAALAATVITYRARSAVRDVGKALGLDAVFVEDLAKSLAWWDRSSDLHKRFEEQGIGGHSDVAELFQSLVQQILGFPRHLSQHVGGFVISRGPISQLVPVENASMADRTVIQWDKEDIESLGLLKVDILALGMLSAIRKSLALVARNHPHIRSVADIPRDDPATWRMLQQADSVGVFQIESRAQMTMLPRLKPACFYDLVIQIAIVRPGPIQGDMVHP